MKTSYLMGVKINKKFGDFITAQQIEGAYDMSSRVEKNLPRKSNRTNKFFIDQETKAEIGSHQIPVPLNSKVLVHPFHFDQQDTSKDNEEYLTAHGTVCAMGDLAYRDRDTGERWKSGVLPKIGDRVTYGKYAGQKIVVKGVKFLLLNDDELTLLASTND
jgi:co-chaperonin GroES (HSP10)